MCLPLRFLASLFIGAALASLRPSCVAAQAALPARLTYHDASHTQRRAVFGVELRGTRPDTVPHGPYRRYWPTGGLAEIGHFTHGQADSIWTRYYPAAPGGVPVVARRLAMRAGQPDGPFAVWHPNGQVAQRGQFRRGQLVDSLTTRTPTGQPRLLARLLPDSTGRLAPTGRFQQWRSGLTATPIYYRARGERLSYNNPYPVADTGRYWVGQLAGGRFVGPLAEYDPDGQLRVRLLYGPAGHVRLVSLYYPAAWREYELRNSYLLDSGQVVRSQLCWQSQWLGPNLLWQYYNWEGTANEADNRVVIRPAPVPHLLAPAACLQAPQPPVALLAGAPGLSARAAFSPFYRYQRGQDHLPAPSKYGAVADQRYQQAQGRRLRRGPTLRLLGQTDTLTGAFSRRHRQVATNSGTRSVETGATLRVYNADGSLSSTSRKTRRYHVARTYEHGHLVRYQQQYYNDGRARLREWDDQGRLHYDARTNREGTTYSRKRDRHGHLPLRRRLERPIQMR